MHSDIEIKNVSSAVEICGMTTKPVRGITEDGKTIYENNLQLDIRNSGSRPLTFIDCTISYRGQNDAFLGSDSDGTLNTVMPGKNCIVSIPAFIPDGTIKKELEITSDVAPSKIAKYGSWVFLGVVTIFWFIKDYTG